MKFVNKLMYIENIEPNRRCYERNKAVIIDSTME